MNEPNTAHTHSAVLRDTRREHIFENIHRTDGHNEDTHIKNRTKTNQRYLCSKISMFRRCNNNLSVDVVRFCSIFCFLFSSSNLVGAELMSVFLCTRAPTFVIVAAQPNTQNTLREFVARVFYEWVFWGFIYSVSQSRTRLSLFIFIVFHLGMVVFFLFYLM